VDLSGWLADKPAPLGHIAALHTDLGQMAATTLGGHPWAAGHWGLLVASWQGCHLTGGWEGSLLPMCYTDTSPQQRGAQTFAFHNSLVLDEYFLHQRLSALQALSHSVLCPYL
jgi:hypothetical protein